jgi:hypothetical protein
MIMVCGADSAFKWVADPCRGRGLKDFSICVRKSSSIIGPGDRCDKVEFFYSALGQVIVQIYKRQNI